MDCLQTCARPLRTLLPRQHRTAHSGSPTRPAQGLEWVLRMYATGAVRDYRFAYDFAAPTLLELVQQLGSLQEQKEAREAQRAARRQGGAAGAAQARLSDGEHEAVEAGGEAAARPRRSLQPLLPAACAMALLPRGGRMHAGEHTVLGLPGMVRLAQSRARFLLHATVLHCACSPAST